MKILLTGATGFVGSSLARLLLQEGYEVKTLVRAEADRRNIDQLDLEVVTGDLKDFESLKSAVRGCNGLYHVAADYRLWARNPQEIYDANVQGTQNLMKAAGESGIERIVYTSSVAVLGLTKNYTPASEDEPVSLDDMVGHYKRSKFLAEECVREMIVRDGLPAVIVNPSAPVGARDIKPTPTGRIIVDYVNGRMPAYVETGLNLVHVDDCAVGHLLAFKFGQVGERYILGGENMTLHKVLLILGNITGRPVTKFKIPHKLLVPLAYSSELFARVANFEPRLNFDTLHMSKKRMYFSSEKAKNELGYKSRSAEKALRDAVEWFNINQYFNHRLEIS